LFLFEEKYTDKGLVFTSSFEEANLIQTFGHLDGFRFYFRLRKGADCNSVRKLRRFTQTEDSGTVLSSHGNTGTSAYRTEYFMSLSSAVLIRTNLIVVSTSKELVATTIYQ
jgi:hypothetical protein